MTIYKYYEVIKNLGEGSLGAVSSARKKDVGGSAYTETKQFGVFTVKKKKDGPIIMSTSTHQREGVCVEVHPARSGFGRVPR